MTAMRTRRLVPPVADPTRHRSGAQGLVEVDGRLVPVEHGPLDSSVGEPPQLLQEGEPEALLPEGRAHEEILQPDAGLADPRAEGAVPEREPGDLPVGLRDEYRGGGLRAEEVLGEGFRVEAD